MIFFFFFPFAIAQSTLRKFLPLVAGPWMHFRVTFRAELFSCMNRGKKLLMTVHPIMLLVGLSQQWQLRYQIISFMAAKPVVNPDLHRHCITWNAVPRLVLRGRGYFHALCCLREQSSAIKVILRLCSVEGWNFSENFGVGKGSDSYGRTFFHSSRFPTVPR